MDEEKIEEMREKRYLKSLDLLQLGRELRLAEKAIERYKGKGDKSRVEELENYCKRLKREIEGRMG